MLHPMKSRLPYPSRAQAEGALRGAFKFTNANHIQSPDCIFDSLLLPITCEWHFPQFMPAFAQSILCGRDFICNLVGISLEHRRYVQVFPYSRMIRLHKDLPKLEIARTRFVRRVSFYRRAPTRNLRKDSVKRCLELQSAVENNAPHGTGAGEALAFLAEC